MLQRDFKSLKMFNGELFEVFMNKFYNLVNGIHSYGDTQIVEKVLKSLPHKFDPITISVEDSKDLTKISLIELIGILQTYKHRIKYRSEDLDQAFQEKLIMNDHPSTYSILDSTSRGRNKGHERGNHGRGRGQSPRKRKISSLPIL